MGGLSQQNWPLANKIEAYSQIFFRLSRLSSKICCTTKSRHTFMMRSLCATATTVYQRIRNHHIQDPIFSRANKFTVTIIVVLMRSKVQITCHSPVDGIFTFCCSICRKECTHHWRWSKWCRFDLFDIEDGKSHLL